MAPAPVSPCTTTARASPPDLAPRAFERFTRGDAARTRGGAGLGLSLVEAIVGAHGGAVTLDSRPGDTTIAVVLPSPAA